MKFHTVVATVAGAILCVSLVVGFSLGPLVAMAGHTAATEGFTPSPLPGLPRSDQRIFATDDSEPLPTLRLEMVAWLQNASSSEATYERIREWSGLEERGLDFCMWIEPMTDSDRIRKVLTTEVCHASGSHADSGHAERIAVIRTEHWGVVPVRLEVTVWPREQS